MNLSRKAYFIKHSSFESLLRLQKILLDTLDYDQVVFRVVNTILFDLGFIDLGYRIIVLTLLNKKKGVLERVALSQTDEAFQALKASAVPFHEIKIPLRANDNLLIKTLKAKKNHITHNWPEIFSPVLTSEQALTNQKAAGIKTSLLFPITVRDEAIGVIIFSMVKSEKDVTQEEKKLIQGFCEIVGLAVENAKLYSYSKFAAERLKRANERLKELDQLKDEFVSIASHELRTPMTAVRSYLWLAIHQPKQTIQEPLKKYLNICYSSTERLIHLVNDMLTVSRIERRKIEISKETILMSDIVQKVYDELSITAKEKEIDLILKMDRKDSQIRGDAEKLREVVQNILGNALKFTPKGGRIDIKVYKSNGIVHVAVKDTASGIPKEDLPKLFQKFSKIEYSYSKHSSQPGTGLGLYISKQIISLHSGDIHVESEVGVGSTFDIQIPYYENK